jgi:small-conductance mechanosensitive channel/CRP-like cAMP-binding protein
VRVRSFDRSRLFFPLFLAIVLFAFYWPFRREPLMLGDVNIRDYLLFAADAALIFFGVRFVDTLIFDVIFARRRNVVAPQLLRGIVAIVLYFFLFTAVLTSIFSLDVKGFLTGTTIVAAVLALALQETLGNLFSGIALHMEDSYEVGDVVHSGEYIGMVEGVSWRATKLRGYNNQTIILPNSVIARERLEVFPRENLNARALQFGIDYHIAPATVIGILTQAASHVEGVAREMKCFARVSGFTDSAVLYEIKYFMRDYSARDRIDADIRKAVWYALKRNAIPFAFPVRVHQEYQPPRALRDVSIDEITTRLEEVDVLSPLSREARATLAAATRVHFYSKSEAIIHHGTMGESMFVVHAGDVAVRLPEPDSTGWHEVANLGPGAVFGEMALLTGEMRSADVVASSDVIALEIEKESLQPIIQGHPELAQAISRKVMERREHLDTVHANDAEDEELTLISRIKSYFGI